MRIVCERSGGFAGLTTRVEIDSNALTAAQNRELQTLIEQAHLLDQPAKKRRANNVAADGFQYDLIVEADEANRTLTLNDGSASAEMLALIDWLMAYKKKK